MVNQGGIDPKDIDVHTAHEKLNDPVYREAVAYAEHMIDLTMNPSADYKASELYQNKNVWASVLKSMVIPFSSVSMNMRSRMMVDYRNIVLGKKTGNKEVRDNAP